MKAPPPRPELCGSSSPSTAWIATAASTAEPPRRSTFSPASTASGSAAATITVGPLPAMGAAAGAASAGVALSGVTVILPDVRSVCAVDVRGGAPGTRETDALAPENLVEAVDAVVLAGGSVYGLAAADGVAAWLGARGRGFALADRPDVPP